MLSMEALTASTAPRLHAKAPTALTVPMPSIEIPTSSTGPVLASSPDPTLKIIGNMISVAWEHFH